MAWTICSFWQRLWMNLFLWSRKSRHNWYKWITINFPQTYNPPSYSWTFCSGLNFPHSMIIYTKNKFSPSHSTITQFQFFKKINKSITYQYSEFLSNIKLGYKLSDLFFFFLQIINLGIVPLNESTNRPFSKFLLGIENQRIDILQYLRHVQRNFRFCNLRKEKQENSLEKSSFSMKYDCRATHNMALLY